MGNKGKKGERHGISSDHLHPQEIAYRKETQLIGSHLRSMRAALGLIESSSEQLDTQEGEILDPLALARKFYKLDPKTVFQTTIVAHYASQIAIAGHLEAIDKSLKRIEGIQIPKQSTAEALEKESYRQDLGDIIEAYKAMNPLSHQRDDGLPTIIEISRMKIPLSDQDRQKIDVLFTYTPEAADRKEALFLTYMMAEKTRLNQLDRSVQVTKAYNLSDEGMEIFERLVNIMDDYFLGYYEKAIDRQWPGTLENPPTFDFPEGGDIFPISLGLALCATGILPSSFDEVVQSGYIYGLQEDSVPLVVKFHEELFESEALENASLGFKEAYKLIQRSYRSGKGRLFIQEQIQATSHSINEPDIQSAWETFIGRWDDIHRFIHGRVLDIGQLQNGVKIKIATHQSGSIDFLFVSSDGQVSHATEVDAQARIVGIPADADSDKAISFIQEAVAKAMDYFKTTSLMREQQSSAKPVIQPLQRRTPAKIQVSPDDQEIESIPTITPPAKPPKKKAIRRELGISIQPDLTAIIEEGEDKKTMVTALDKYIEGYKGISSSAQDQANSEIEALKTGRTRYELIQLSKKLGIKVFRLVSGHYRVYFALPGDQEIILMNIKPRRDAYDPDEIRALSERVLALLAKRKQN